MAGIEVCHSRIESDGTLERNSIGLSVFGLDVEITQAKTVGV